MINLLDQSHGFFDVFCERVVVKVDGGIEKFAHVIVHECRRRTTTEPQTLNSSVGTGAEEGAAPPNWATHSKHGTQELLQGDLRSSDIVRQPAGV